MKNQNNCIFSANDPQEIMKTLGNLSTNSVLTSLQMPTIVNEKLYLVIISEQMYISEKCMKSFFTICPRYIVRKEN